MRGRVRTGGTGGIGVLAAGQACPGGRAPNPSAFALPAAGQQGTRRNDLQGFGLAQMDLSLRRVFVIEGRTNLQFRVDAFNALNHPNFSIRLRLFSQQSFDTGETAVTIDAESVPGRAQPTLSTGRSSFAPTLLEAVILSRTKFPQPRRRFHHGDSHRSRIEAHHRIGSQHRRRSLRTRSRRNCCAGTPVRPRRRRPPSNCRGFPSSSCER